MRGSIGAVLLGTFTLRFSTGLTGAMLLYYLADLPSFGGPPVSSTVAGVLTAAYFAAELIGSPFFGVVSDRHGAHRIMQVGPILGAIAVLITAFTTDLWLLGGTRWLEGLAAAASIPSILGYIALATSGDEGLRGRAVARFEAATIGGLGIGAVAAGPLFETLGRWAFVVNAVVYGISFAIYRYRVRPIAPQSEPGEGEPRSLDLGRYARLITTSGVWLLAPTWIALNAIIGAWTSQGVFQLVLDNPNPAFADQVLMGGFAPTQVSIGMAVALVAFFAGIFIWGNLFRRFRRTTIMAVGAVGGMVMIGAIYALNHSAGWPVIGLLGMVGVALAGLFVLAGATPAALGMLADISEIHPDDRGAIMGLYSVFLGVGQIIGSIASGAAADWRGLDGLLAVSLVFLLVALVPLYWLRASEHLVGQPSASLHAET